MTKYSLAEEEGIEPSYVGVKDQCLTAWLLLNAVPISFMENRDKNRCSLDKDSNLVGKSPDFLPPMSS